jgi:hypothetical protein
MFSWCNVFVSPGLRLDYQRFVTDYTGSHVQSNSRIWVQIQTGRTVQNPVLVIRAGLPEKWNFSGRSVRVTWTGDGQFVWRLFLPSIDTAVWLYLPGYFPTCPPYIALYSVAGCCKFSLEPRLRIYRYISRNGALFFIWGIAYQLLHVHGACNESSQMKKNWLGFNCTKLLIFRVG